MKTRLEIKRSQVARRRIAWLLQAGDYSLKTATFLMVAGGAMIMAAPGVPLEGLWLGIGGIPVLAAALWVKLLVRKIESDITDEWTAFYAGTRWETPAGERVVAVKGHFSASILTVRLADDPHDVFSTSLANLKQIEGETARYLDRSEIAACATTAAGRWAVGLALVFPFVVSFGLTFSYAAPDVAGSPLATVLHCIAFCASAVAPIAYAFVSVDGGAGYHENITLKRLSVTKWRTTSGRVGTVRYAFRRTGEDVFNTDILDLVFSDGEKKRFERQDLVPVDPVEFSLAA